MYRDKREGDRGAWVLEVAVVVLCVVGLYALCASAASNWKVGSFTKNTTTGNQTFTHGVGTTPKAMIFWTGSGTNENFFAGYHFGFGATDGTSSRSLSSASEDATAKGDASRRITAFPITVVAGSEVTMSEASFVSWDATSTILNWTTTTATADVVHYLGIGGSDISAKVVEWAMPSATGNKSITGVGFKPDVVMTFQGGSTLTAALPTSEAFGAFGFAAMDGSGDQNAVTVSAWDNGNSADTGRSQRTDSCLLNCSFNGDQERASYVSMDSNGFTMNFSRAVTTTRAFSLALKGLNVKVGSFTKSTGTPTAMQTVTSDTFTPAIVMLYGTQDSTFAFAMEGRFGFGASDGSTHGSTAFVDQDGAAIMNVDSIDKTSQAYIKVNNNTPTIDAEASVSSFVSNGFVLNWSTNDAVASDLLFLSMGSLPASAIKLAEFEADLASGGVALRWRTGWEVENVGFHVYREDGNRRVRLTPGLVAGSTFLVGGVRLRAGHSYQWWDRGGRVDSRYWLEDVDVSGRSTWNGPFTIRQSGAGGTANSATLGALGTGSRLQVTARPVLATGPSRAASASAKQPLKQPSTVDAWSGAGAAAVKIGVRERGLHRIDRAALLAAGLSATVDPRKLHMYVDGAEVAIGIAGAWLGSGDPPQAEDAVEFFASGFETPYTDEQVYWLVEETMDGKRIARVTAMDTAPGGAPSSVLYQVKRQDKSIYFAALHNGDDENFFGDILAQDPVQQAIALRDVARDRAGVTAKVSLSLQGVTHAPHDVKASINGHDLGTVSFADQAQGTLRSTVPQDWLVEGANNVVLTAQAGEKDVVLVDWLAIQYWRRAVAVDDHFEIEASQTATVEGFTTPDVRVLDVTTPQDVRELLGRVTEQGGWYVVDASLAAQGKRLLWTGSATAILTPAWVRANIPSRWLRDGDGSDLLIVADGSLLPSLEPLRRHRESQGAKVALIDVDDMYDEMSNGVKTPWALRDFLRQAMDRWSKKPRSVLLVGDASLDPKGYLGHGRQDLVPTKMVDTPILETASDDWFATKDGDRVAEIPIGRLPARTVEEASLMVAKILAFEEEPLGDRAVLLVSDRDDEYAFHNVVPSLRRLVPAGHRVQELSRDKNSPADIVGAINDGPWLVDYVGHGSVEQWAGLLLTTSAARQLGNGNRLPIVTAMTCLNGFFHDVYTESLAEGLLRAEGGGAAAVWASSAVTPAGLQVDLNRAFVGGIMETAKTMGEAVQIAKRAVNEPDVSPTWILLGDPAMRLPLSSAMAPTQGKVPVAGGCGCRSVDTPANRFAAVFIVLGLLVAMRCLRALRVPRPRRG